MIGNLLLLAAVGAGAAWLLSRSVRISMPVERAMALGAVGAVVAGFAIKVLAPLFFSVVAAFVGACAAVWLAERRRARPR